MTHKPFREISLFPNAISKTAEQENTFFSCILLSGHLLLCWSSETKKKKKTVDRIKLLNINLVDKYGFLFFFLRRPKRLYRNIQNDWLRRRPFDVLCSTLFLFYIRFTLLTLYLYTPVCNTL